MFYFADCRPRFVLHELLTTASDLLVGEHLEVAFHAVICFLSVFDNLHVRDLLGYYLQVCVLI